VAVAQAQARSLGVRCHALAATVEGRGSLQARAREARYAALTRCARAIGAERIAIAHTREDQAETVLGRVLRGGGVRALGGIDPARADGVIRPLIDCGRADVHALASRTLDALAIDPSNVDPRFQRTRLRGELLPALERENPSVVEQLAGLADEARALLAAVSPMVTELLARAVDGEAPTDGPRLRVAALLQAPQAVRRLALAQWLQAVTGAPAGRAQLDQAESLLGRTGEVWLTHGLTLRLTRADARVVHEGSARRAPAS
jgi:tRNA(Ile)-lysidine synthase